MAVDLRRGKMISFKHVILIQMWVIMKKPIKRKNGKYTYDARPFLPVDNKRVIKIFTGNNAREKADAFAVEIEKQRDAKGLVSDQVKLAWEH